MCFCCHQIGQVQFDSTAVLTNFVSAVKVRLLLVDQDKKEYKIIQYILKVNLRRSLFNPAHFASAQ